MSIPEIQTILSNYLNICINSLAINSVVKHWRMMESFFFSDECYKILLNYQQAVRQTQNLYSHLTTPAERLRAGDEPV